MKKNIKFVEKDIDDLLKHSEVEKRVKGDRDDYRHQNHLTLFKRAKHLIQVLRKENKDARTLINGPQTIWLVYGIDTLTHEKYLCGAFKCFYKAREFADAYSVFGNEVDSKIEGIEVK